MSFVSIRQKRRSNRSFGFLLYASFFVFALLQLFICCDVGVVEASSGPPRIKELTYINKEGTILETRMDAVEFTVKTDQDLYLTEGIPCRQTCNAPQAARGPKEVDTCDFSYSGSKCGKNLEPYCNKYKPSYCEQEYEWTRLHLDGSNPPTHIFGYEGVPQFYRFFVNDPCAAFRIKITLHFGDVSWFMTDDPTIPTVHHYNVYQAKIANYNKPMVICPSSGYFRLGTWTLGIYAIGQANYTLKVESLDLKELTNPPEQKKKLHQ
eukprot:TRINITY_DN464_c0_g3_i1.p1 TRINITY_DN464_c0_g3~~TRINITY_DN464_c0_g3_i1.p1  ORF type:complete len:265 (+),score=40.46 TRINITY_DN464_c0_g3_i1:404-1198(+)